MESELLSGTAFGRYYNNMRFHTVALALALACGFTAPIEAKQKTIKYSSKPAKPKKPKVRKYKPAKFKTSKFKPAKVK
jgi:hypothetical protein